MKIITQALLSGILLINVACKKNNEEPAQDIPTQSSFAYSTFSIPVNAATDVEVRQDLLYLTFTKQGNQAHLPHLSIQIAEFHGVGTYNLSSGKVTVYGDEDGNEFYWKNFHNQFNDEFKGEGSIKITRCDSRFVAELNGKLFHEEVQGSKVIFKETSFQGKTNQKIFR